MAEYQAAEGPCRPRANLVTQLLTDGLGDRKVLLVDLAVD